MRNQIALFTLLPLTIMLLARGSWGFEGSAKSSVQLRLPPSYQLEQSSPSTAGTPVILQFTPGEIRVPLELYIFPTAGVGGNLITDFGGRFEKLGAVVDESAGTVRFNYGYPGPLRFLAVYGSTETMYSLVFGKSRELSSREPIPVLEVTPSLAVHQLGFDLQGPNGEARVPGDAAGFFIFDLKKGLGFGIPALPQALNNFWI